MVPDQVIVLEEHLPSCLPAGEALQFLEVAEVFVVSKDSHQGRGAS